MFGDFFTEHFLASLIGLLVLNMRLGPLGSGVDRPSSDGFVGMPGFHAIAPTLPGWREREEGMIRVTRNPRKNRPEAQ